MDDVKQWVLLPQLKELRDYQLARPDELRDSYGFNVMTPFESLAIGGTPSNSKVLDQRGDALDDWHTPILILGGGRYKDKASIEEVNLLRKKIGFLIVTPPSLGFIDPELLEERLAFKLELLDPKTGITLKDPTILGIWDPQTKGSIKPQGRDLNKEYYQKRKNWKERHPDDKNSLWRFMRDGKSYAETESSKPPEKE